MGISTNLVFSDWVRIFKSPLTTMAAIDRVVHHSVILDLMPVESYRAHAALDQQRHQPQPAGAATGVLGNISAEPVGQEGA